MATDKDLLIPGGATSVELRLPAGLTRELTQVRIGRTFVFGVLEDGLSWCLIRLSSVLAFRFHVGQEKAISAVQWTRRTAIELLADLVFPAAAIIQFQEQPKQLVNCVVLALARGLIVTDSYQHSHIPLAAIRSIEISSNYRY